MRLNKNRLFGESWAARLRHGPCLTGRGRCGAATLPHWFGDRVRTSRSAPTRAPWRGIVRYRLCLASFGLLFVTAVVRATGGMSPGPVRSPQAAAAKPAPQAPAAPPAGYAGSDTCLTCHSDKEGTIKGTKHGQAKNPRSPEATHGCESCHGPGQAHVDDDAKGHIKKFGQLKPAEINETCLTCHNRGSHAA